jgi:hypothetical protein
LLVRVCQIQFHKNQKNMQFMRVSYAGLILAISAFTIPKFQKEHGQTEHAFNSPIGKDSATLIALLHPMAFQETPIDVEGRTSQISVEHWMGTGKIADESIRSLTGGNAIKLISVGGGLTAGVQNGGLYREGQLTAYPNLVARQLGSNDFTTPAFDENEKNGTGFLILVDDENPFPRYRHVINNIATVNTELSDNPPIFKSFLTGTRNLSAPGLCTDGLSSSWGPWMKGQVVNQTSGKSWAKYMPFLWRFSPKSFYETSTLLDYIETNVDYNFFILEDIHERFLNALRCRAQIGISDLIGDLQTGNDAGLRTIQQLTKGGKRGVVFTIPAFSTLACYNWYTPEYLKQKAPALQLSVRHPSGSIEDIASEEPFWPLPSRAVDSLYRNLNTGSLVKMTFEDSDVLSRSEVLQYESAVKIYNDRIRKWANQYNLAVVDLEEIYGRVHDGSISIGDWLKIDGGPRGNFFSSDGIYPTPLGQAIIANDVLKSINETYKTNVPLVNIQSYAEAINLKLKTN